MYRRLTRALLFIWYRRLRRMHHGWPLPTGWRMLSLRSLWPSHGQEDTQVGGAPGEAQHTGGRRRSRLPDLVQPTWTSWGSAQGYNALSADRHRRGRRQDDYWRLARAKWLRHQQDQVQEGSEERSAHEVQPAPQLCASARLPASRRLPRHGRASSQRAGHRCRQRPGSQQWRVGGPCSFAWHHDWSPARVGPRRHAD